MILSASFLTAKSCSVAEHTIICSRVPSEVILGIWPWILLMSCSYLRTSWIGAKVPYEAICLPHPALSRPSASSRMKKRH